MKKSKKNRKYNEGVKDSMRVLYAHISSVEHGTGFKASELATEYLDLMKHVYDTIGTLHRHDR